MTESGADRVTFDRRPDDYKHWRLEVDPPIATLTMVVDPDGGLQEGYSLKLNSYDLGVDIELYDAVQRLRFEHPEVHVVVLTGGVDKVFCAGANIQMLAGSTHIHKVNFCKFTNETRNAIEDAATKSGQPWLAAINGSAAGGGYELALACDEIVLVDDRSSAVSLPEVAMLGVLPGTGGLTRVVDKRHVRRDLADVFATRTEGVRGQQAVDWRLVDEVVPPSRFAEAVRERALRLAGRSDRPAATEARGVPMTPLQRTISEDRLTYTTLAVEIDRSLGTATFIITGPEEDGPATLAEAEDAGPGFWPLAACRALDDAVLHLRFNEPDVGTWVLRTVGAASEVLGADRMIREHAGHWLMREITLYWARTLKRLDLSARTLLTLVDPGSCFVGTLAELVLVADRSFMLDDGTTVLQLTDANDGCYRMSNGLSRLATRFYGRDADLAAARGRFGTALHARDAASLGLVTFTPDDLDWDDEIRMTLEERASFSPDALTGMEANLRFVGPETMETKIFGRLSAWQNWIFQRPNAVGPDGALRRFGSGSRPAYDKARV